MKKDITDIIKNDTKITSEELTKKIQETIQLDKKNTMSSEVGIMMNNLERNKSNLNLGDLLTLLDGVCPLQMSVFITTNNINLLDPALVRAGRVYKMELRKVSQETLLKIISDYYKEIAVEENISLDGDYTIAEICEICKLSATIEQCMEIIKKQN